MTMLCVCAGVVFSVLLAAAPAPLRAAQAATPAPCGGVPAPDDPAPTLEQAFATPIADAAVLGLIERIVDIPREARAASLDSAQRPVKAEVRGRIDRAVRAGCLGPLVSQAAVRAANELSVSWSDLPAEKVDAFVAKRLILALAAEAARQSLPADTLAAALDGMLAPQSGPASAAPVAASCTAADSTPKLAHAVQPQYPVDPHALQVSASVRVRVQFDGLGLKRSVSLYAAHYAVDGEDHAALVEASLVAVALSSFEATTPGCPIAPGTYLFRYDFRP